MREIVIDSFAGGGGTSEGIKAATGRDPDIAVNHDRFALAMHRINHPDTHHLVEDVTEIRFTLEQQGYMCGNSVCPPEAAALVRANYEPRQVRQPSRRAAELQPSFLEAAE